MTTNPLPPAMTVIACDRPGGPDQLRLASRPIPDMADDEVLIAVAAAGVNRADVMQRKGQYPPPPGASPLPGLEVSGVVVATGDQVSTLKVGDRVCALLGGGGYAAYVAVPAAHCLPVPAGLSMNEAAGLIEAAVTIYANLFDEAGTGRRVQPNETVLLHGGTSGIGSLAIQLIRQTGASVITTVGSPAKMEICYGLGADFVVNYKTEDFVEATLRATNRRGAHVVLDMVGGTYINRNLRALAARGHHVSISTLTGPVAEVDIRLIMAKRLIMTGSTLRGRDKAEKARLVAATGVAFWPWVAAGKVKPLIYEVYPLAEAAEAHRVMESGRHAGKLVLEVARAGSF